jgi:hypothetical protein
MKNATLPFIQTIVVSCIKVILIVLNCYGFTCSVWHHLSILYRPI